MLLNTKQKATKKKQQRYHSNTVHVQLAFEYS